MREEYDIKKLNPRKNPYAEKLKKRQITIDLDITVVDYFKQLSSESGVPYQTLINLYLLDCANNQKHLNISWT